MANGITVKDMADELGVTKQTLFNRMKQRPLSSLIDGHLTVEGQTIYLDRHAVKHIRKMFIEGELQEGARQAPSNFDGYIDRYVALYDTAIQSMKDEIDQLKDTVKLFDGILDGKDKEIALLQEQLEVKDRQIDYLQQDKATTTVALLKAQESAQAAQALHAGSMQKLLEDEKPKKKGFFARFKDDEL
ncbi:MAG: hypothetical protein ACRCWR_02590 [Saezia sp.]